MPTKAAIGTWAYMFGPYEDNPVPLNEVIEKLQELGFDGLELAGFSPHAGLKDYPTSESRKELRARINDHGLEVCGVAADLWSYAPGADDEQVRKDWMDAFKAHTELCIDVGSPSIRMDTCLPPTILEEQDYDATWQRTVENFRAASAYADSVGLFVVWEFEPGFVFNKPSEIVKMVQDVGHTAFRVLYDTCHAHMCAAVGARQPEPKETLPGGAVTLARMLTGQIGHVHLIDSDNTLHDDETSTHAPFGQGVIDFDEVIPAILDAGYDSDWWSIDLCFWPEAWEVTAQSKEFLDQIMAKYG